MNSTVVLENKKQQLKRLKKPETQNELRFQSRTLNVCFRFLLTSDL